MKKLHLICNAHLDPIWQWTWDEGFSAVLATFKSAADLAEEFDYVFCHGEALLYEEIEKKAPALFKRIQDLVKRGKWVVTGGWYLQPDVLMPCGESIVRQIEVGQKYFQEKFGITPTVATNYDSFGHSLGLVQIMKKFGYNGYLICRPGSWQFDYPSRFFNWVAPDGSSIPVSHSSSYNSVLGKAVEKIQGYACGNVGGMLGAEQTAGSRADLEDVDYVLWGVGNHGGGPSRKDLQDIANLKIEDVELVHSTPERLFSDNIHIGGEVKTSLITCMPGCYATMARLKMAYRETENVFYATEKMLSVAKMAGYNVDLSDMKVAEKKMLLAMFHDILPGTSIVEGEQDGMELLSMTKKIVKDYRTGAFLYLVMGEDVAKEGEFPVFVFNYMPYEVQTPITVEFSLADQNWSEEFHYTPVVYAGGVEIPCQTVKEGSTLNLDWRKRIVFEGKLKPMGITKFSVYVKQTPAQSKKAAPCTIEAYLPKLLREPISLEMREDTVDPWGMSNEELKGLGKNPKPFRLMSEQEAAAFCGVKEAISPVRKIEDGAVLTSVEVFYTADNTNAVIEYKLYKNQPYFDLKATIEYADKNKLIRLKVPTPQGVVVGDGPYIVEEKPRNAEICFQKWFGVKTDNGEIFSIINNCTYAGKAEDGYLALDLVRGAGYCVHPIADRELYPQDRYLPRIEGGRYEFNLRIYQASVDKVCAEAELYNQAPYAINVFPTGGDKKSASLYVDKAVSMPVCKISDNGYVMRFFNPNATAQEFTLTIGDKTKALSLAPYEIVSVEYTDEITVSHETILT